MDHDEEELFSDDDSDNFNFNFNLTSVNNASGDHVLERVDVGVGGVATGIALYVLSFLTFVGNAMVLHAIRTEKRLQTVSDRDGGWNALYRVVVSYDSTGRLLVVCTW